MDWMRFLQTSLVENFVISRFKPATSHLGRGYFQVVCILEVDNLIKDVVIHSFITLLQVQDVTDPTGRRLGVDALPAIVGWLSNGEKHVLKTGISVKDIKSAVNDLSILLDGFEKKNKKEGTRKAKTSTEEKQITLLMGSNFDALCGESTPVCIIGAFRSSRAREKLESILSMVSLIFLRRVSFLG